MEKVKISIVSPVYKAEKIVDELVKRIKEEISLITDSYEIILVEDGSPDDSWAAIERNCQKDSKVKGIKLSRNFGQHYAITAGISRAKGENIVLMDCDLQDNPAFIKDLIKEREKGFDIVFTQRKKRKHGLIKSFNSWFYNKLFKIFSESKYDINAGSLVCFNRQVADVFLILKDKDRLYLQMLKWVGFSSTTLIVEHQSRYEGESSYNLFKLIKLGVQGWTSHSNKLLNISIFLGLFISILSFLAGIFVIIRYVFYELQPGWPSIVVSIFFSTGLILLSIGITGIYIGKIFEQVKDRPLFIIDEELNNE